MGVIKDISQLPDWFKLENYDASNTFTPEDWARELEVRSWETLMIEIIQSTPPGFLRREGTDASDENLLAAITSGCPRAPRQRHRPDWGPTSYFSLSIGQKCVRPILWDEITLRDFDVPPVTYQLMYDDINRTSATRRAHIQVDLTAPDSVLTKQFAALLKEYRRIFKLKNPGKVATDASVAKLRQYQVLPYIDLKNWGALTGTTIQAATYAEALFPGIPERDDRFVRETLDAWSQTALSPGFIGSLSRPEY